MYGYLFFSSVFGFGSKVMLNEIQEKTTRSAGNVMCSISIKGVTSTIINTINFRKNAEMKLTVIK